METIRTALKGRLQMESPQTIVHPSRTAAAVLVPFFEQDGNPHLLFTKRSGTVQHHRNEISFPGGVKEPADPDLRFTALRELQEEVAVPPENVDVLGCMEPIETYSSSYVVVPFVGVLKRGSGFIPNPEVEQILEIPLTHFMDPAIFRQEKLVLENRAMTVYYYRWQSHTIWGLTGRILKILLDLMRRSVNP